VLTSLSGKIGKTSANSVFRGFREVKSAKGPEAPSWADPNQRNAHSAVRDEDEVLRRWNQYVALLLHHNNFFCIFGTTTELTCIHHCLVTIINVLVLLFIKIPFPGDSKLTL